MPVYPSQLKDDGYDIADYYDILENYGNLDDFKSLVSSIHARGMRIITDLVLNHTSDQHIWFQQARTDPKSPYREYYVWSDTDKKYEQARIIFLDIEDSNWTWDEGAGQYYWHRFYASQPDLNFDNPSVQTEMLNVMKFWLDLGVDGFRTDAVPYLFEREGTNCENLPETHAYLKKVRRFIDDHYPDRILLCEANQWPEDVRPYFGDGDEFHMGFHFPLMPRIYMALRQADRRPLVWILDQTPDIPDESQWCTFLRNHDELTLEMVTEQERQWMWQEYAPEPRMRLNLGIRRRLAPLLDGDQRKIELLYSLLFSLPGSPIIYYGDEIGMGDNIWLDDRNGVRTPMQWNADKNAGFSTAEPCHLYAPVISQGQFDYHRVNVAAQQSNPDSIWSVISQMIKVRKRHLSFGLGQFDWVDVGSPAVAAYWRRYQDEAMLVLNNLSDSTQNIELELPDSSSSKYVDLLSGLQVIPPQNKNFSLEVDPYQYLWLHAD
jgi:maltose alpha-D-glucosyltransferase/alpha-amylase